MAFFVDLVCISIIEKLISIQLYYVFKQVFQHAPQELRTYFTQEFSSLRLTQLIIVFGSYFLISYLLSDGKTLGKLVFNLKVVSKRDDQEVSIKQYFLRSFGYLICYLTGSFLFLLPMLNKRGTGIADWISSTKVSIDEPIKDISNKEDSDDDNDYKKEQLKLFA